MNSVFKIISSEQWEEAKIIIEKNLPNSKEKLKYDGNTLFYDGNILLKNVSSFKMSKDLDILTIEIILDNISVDIRILEKSQFKFSKEMIISKILK